MKNKFKETVLRRCNELAMRARGRVGTNPNVGSIIIDSSNHKILGEGWHQFFGGPHAEINAMRKAARHHSLSGMSIAISLEPCNHQGKTPACTSTIMDHQLSEVWVDQIDPDPRMSGQSMDLLHKADLNVPAALNTPEGRSVIYPFRISNKLQRPFLRLKMAISSDHYIGQSHKRVKISNAISDRWVHRIRNETQAIMAGTNTILNDNPALTSRYGNKNQPIRILPDRKGILPDDLKVFTEEGKNIVLTASGRRNYPAKVLRIDPHDLSAAFHELYNHGIGSILIEGGSQLFTSLFDQGLWDELIVIQNTDLRLESGIPAPVFPPISAHFQTKLDTDTINFIINPHCR